MNSRQTHTPALCRVDATTDAHSRGLCRRALLASALLAAPLLAAAQIVPGALPRLAPPAAALVLPANLPEISQPSGVRPISASEGQLISQALNQANSQAMADVRQLSMPSGAPVPAGCTRRILAFGTVGANTSFTVRPGQQVVLQGCFANAPQGSMHLNGIGGAGFIALQVLDWKPNYVTARVPMAISGVYDRPVRLQLRFGDGDFSNELTGQFVATRAKYEISGTALASAVDLKFVSVPAAAMIFSWQYSVAPFEGQAVPADLTNSAKPGIFIGTPNGPQLGSYYLKPKNPQHKLHGYYASLYFGQSQFSNWGPDGELTLDWASSKPVDQFFPMHKLRFDKLVLEAPVGTVQGTLLP